MSNHLNNLSKSVMGIIASSDDATTKENANKDAKLVPTQRDLVAGAVAKAMALDEILPKRISNAHVSGDIHFHDLDYSPLFPIFNCMLIDYEGMLKYGFKMGSADIDTPKSITTACAVVAQITASVASNIYGGNTLARIDEILAPYVTASAKKHHNRGERYGLPAHQLEKYVKECTEKECYDAFQALEYEINTLQTSNG
jgi:ribonucleoside-triphosphate reductase